MRRVLTYGTFDLFHVGHLNLLERLRALGDSLTVAISTDEFNLGKNKRCVVSYEDRARIVGALKCVDQVIPEITWEQKADDIRRLDIAVLGMGHDWEGKFDELKSLCEVVYLPRTEGISTTLLKHVIGQGTGASPDSIDVVVVEQSASKDVPPLHQDRGEDDSEGASPAARELATCARSGESAGDAPSNSPPAAQAAEAPPRMDIWIR